VKGTQMQMRAYQAIGKGFVCAFEMKGIENENKFKTFNYNQ